ncbi:Glyoxalase I, partial [human gut metagenome]
IHSEYEKIKSCGYTKFKLKNNKEIYKVENGFLFKVIAPEGTEIEFRDSQI